MGYREYGARACNKDCVLDGAYPNLQWWGSMIRGSQREKKNRHQGVWDQ